MIRTPLRPYQQEAVERALSFDGFLLFPEQRTGKCLMSLAVVDHRKPRHLWIICPIQAIKVWKKQIIEHLEVDWDCDLVIMNYEELYRRKKTYYREAAGLKRSGGSMMIIADEIHRIKKRGSKHGRSARILARRFRYRLGLTGTPLGQGLQDAWAQFNFVDPKVFGPWDSKFHKKTKERLIEGFADRYLVYGGFGDFKIVDYQNETEFYEKFHSRSFRVTLREARGATRPLRLVHKRLFFDLGTTSRELYDELEEKLIVEVNKKKVSVPVIVALSMKLQQVTGGFVIDSEDGDIHRVGSEKTRQFLKLVRRLGRQKFVVVCRFLHEIEWLQGELDIQGVSWKRVIGGEPFAGHFDTQAVLIQIQSGVAVDMSAADHTIFYSGDFSYLNYEQVKSRILNFEKPYGSFYYLLARDTIDELIYQAVRRKKNLAHLVLDKYRKQRHARKS